MYILVTRPLPEANVLVSNLIKLGYQAYSMPLIHFLPGKDLNILSFKLNKLNKNDYIFMFSKRSVYFTNKKMIKHKLYWPKNIYYYAIGQQTASLMNLYSGCTIKYPEQENSECLISMINLNKIKGKSALIFQGNQGRKLLHNVLLKNDVKTYFCESYKIRYNIYNGHKQGKYLSNLGINTLIVTSEGILKKLYYLFPTKYRQKWLLNCKIILISKRLALLANNLGWKDIIVTNGANNFSILDYFIKNRY